ncbi:MAG: hypothetical protein KJN61_05935, partial [Gammaproteobacteria bacterium]|nr:hypothetical protein [Gammaproteobacteria bacterium]
MKNQRLFFILMFTFCTCAVTNLQAQEIDAESHRSIVAALQSHVKKHPSTFPLESLDGGAQDFAEGLQNVYFGYGERRYT